MKSRFASVLVVVATLLAGAAGAASGDTRDSIKVDHAASVAGSVIPPGIYRVELAADMDSVRFVQGKRTVVEAPCTVALTQPVYPGNAVHYRNGDGGQDRLVKIVLASSRLAIEFPSDPAGANGAPAVAADRP